MKSRYINDREIAILSAVCRTEEWLPLEVSSLTGMRIGDVLKIKRTDLNEQENCIEYTAEKTGKSGRAYITKTLFTRLLEKAGKNSYDYVFFSPKKPSEHLSRQAVWYRIKKACERAGVDSTGISPHSMRKVFAVNLYRREGISAVKAQLQHSSVDVTEIYALADWLSSENENLPLLRKDIARIAHIVCGYVEEKLKITEGDQKE